MNVHLIYLTIIFVMYVVAGQMIVVFVWTTNELIKGGGSIQGRKQNAMINMSRQLQMVRLLWPIIGLQGMFRARRKP